MKAVQNQLKAWPEGMLPKFPRPTRRLTASRLWKGRGLSTDFLIRLQRSPSPNATPRIMKQIQILLRGPPLKTMRAASKRAVGQKNGAWLKNGMATSKAELLIDALI